MNAIVIRPDNSMQVFKFTYEDDAIRKQIGGWLELVPHPWGIDATHTVYVDEEGSLKKLPTNHMATFVMESLGYKFSTVEMKNKLPYKQVVRGPAVFVNGLGGGLTYSEIRQIQDLIMEF